MSNVALTVGAATPPVMAAPACHHFEVDTDLAEFRNARVRELSRPARPPSDAGRSAMPAGRRIGS
ncbi:hypothetical protein AB0C10_16990 [Microbispora amethystogenes]|uniref:hypothetical protein n=1 Tax=Microbispora amethystogenes TaxID=1427754 RepID=UPI0034103C2D